MKKYVINKPTANVRIQYVEGNNDKIEIYAISPIGGNAAQLTKKEVLELTEFLVTLAGNKED